MWIVEWKSYQETGIWACKGRFAVGFRTESQAEQVKGYLERENGLYYEVKWVEGF